MFQRIRLASARISPLVACLALTALVGCVDATVESSAVDQEQDLKAGGNPKWLYDGLMPALDDVAITVSLQGHTARVTGHLKSTFKGSLPYYAVTEPSGTRTRVTVVYPVATGATATSNGPGTYGTIFGLAYVTTTDKAAWGGFPFLKYHAKRGLAFHGPITQKDGEWKLIRGPVSHGCNRMQGEHVVELAHILGIDMRVPHKASEQFTLKAQIAVIPGLDSWNGHPVDVDYAALASVKRPTGPTVRMFATWDSRKLIRQVCAWQPKLWTTDPIKNAHHCDYAGKDTIDVLTGKAIP